MEKIPVFIVDDQNLFRQSLALLINSVDSLVLCGDFANGTSFLNSLQHLDKSQTYIALIDIDMPVMNGIELNEILHEQYPHIRVIILSVHISPSLIAQMIHAKASAYLEKNCDKEELITAIQSVYKTEFYFNKKTLKAVQDNAGGKAQSQKLQDNLPVKLTTRDKQIILLICTEHNNAEIAKKLYLSPRTIEGHKNKLLKKIECKSTAGLVLFAIRYGLFSINK